jgi:hypothetical protein
MALTSAERQRAYIARLKAGIPTATKPRRLIDRRSKPQRWDDAVADLLDLLDGYQDVRDNLPDALAGGAYAEKLDAILELRESVETLADAELPKGFGRD